MKNLGYKYPKSPEVMASSSEAKEIMYPRLDIGSEYGNGSDIDLGNLPVGKEMTATVKLRVKQVGQRSTEKGTKRYYCFEVMAIDLPDLPKSESQAKTEKLHMMSKEYGG